MVNAPKKNFSPLPAGRYNKSTKRSTRQRHQANKGKSSFKAERVRAVGVLRSLRSLKKVAAGRRRETHFLSNKEKEKWIEDYVEGETAVARKRVEDAETAIKQRQGDMRNAEKAGLTTTKPEITFEEMLNAIGDSLSGLARSDDEEDGEDEDDKEEDPVGGKLSEDDEPGWVMGTISKMVHYHMECFRRKQMKLDELTQCGWGDAADYLRKRDKKYWMTEWKVPAVAQPQTADDAASSAPTTFGEPMETLDSVPRKLQMLQVTSRQESSYIRLGAWKSRTLEPIPSLPPTSMPASYLIQKSKHVEPVSFHPCISSPKVITIYKSDSTDEMVTAPASLEEWIGKLVFVTMYQFEM